MDFGELIGLAAIIFYFILRNVGSKKPARQRPTPPKPDGAPAGDMDLSDALRQIRRELGFEPPEAEAPPADAGRDLSRAEPVPETAPVPPSPVPRARLEKTAPAGEPRPDAARLRPEKGFRAEESFEGAAEVGTFLREEAFEARRPAKLMEPVRAASVEVEAAAAEMRRRGRSETHALLQRLKRPSEAREAMVLREILGPPKSRR